MYLVDLSKTIGGLDHRHIPFEGHPPSVEYSLLNTHGEHGRTNATLKFNIHEGTHIDPPYHFIADGATIDQIPISDFFAPAYIARVHDAAPGNEIRLDQVLETVDLPEDLAGEVLIIDSAWDSRAKDEEYYVNAPYLSQELADWIVAKRLKAIGLTNPPDKVEAPHEGDAPIHRTLLGHGILIIENLANLDAVNQERFYIGAFPLKIYKGCGGPARVVAFLDFDLV